MIFASTPSGGNKHHSITFEMKGEQPPITISKSNVCYTLAAAKVKSHLFELLDTTCKPIASKSQQFNQED